MIDSKMMRLLLSSMLRVQTVLGLASIVFLVFLPLLPAFADTVTPQFVSLATVDRQTPPWNPSATFQGYGLFIDVGVNDTSGLSDLPSSITLTQTGATTITVPFSNQSGPTGKEYFAFLKDTADINRTGVYDVNVATVANGTVTFKTHTQDNVFQMPLATGLTLSDNSTTPMFSFNTVTGANQYSYQIRASDGTVVFNAADMTQGQCFVSTTPSFQRVPAGKLFSGQSYFFEARALSCDFSSGVAPDVAAQNFWDNRSDTFSSAFSPVPEPSSLVLMSSAFPGLMGFLWLRRRRVTKPV